jgi:hypothetical protein
MGIPPGAAFFTGLAALRLRPGSLGLKDRACEAAVLERIFWEARPTGRMRLSISSVSNVSIAGTADGNLRNLW